MNSVSSGWPVRTRTLALVAVTFFGATRGTANAYTISNELSDGCHERITAAALREVRAVLETARPLAVSRDERALIDDLQFAPDDDMRDLGGATLLAAVRDNDLKGRSSDDLSALAEVHGDPNGQQEHCLRGPGQKEPNGSQAAVDACRAFIRERAQAALAGLDDAGMPDLNTRTALTIHLSIRGTVHAPLPTYYVAAGQAIHAVEDSFTHTYRTADEKQITVVLNWLDQVNGTLDESRDGPGHAKALDRCDDPDALRKTRRLLATEAATAFLRATLDPTLTHDEKMTAIDALLDTYVGYSAGCTFANHWCDAPENQYKDPAGCGCTVGPSHPGVGGMLGGGALLVGGLARRKRGGQKRARRRAAAARVVGGLILCATLAGAEPRPETRTAAPLARDASPTLPQAVTKTETTTTPSETPGTPPTTATVVTTGTVTTTTVTTPTSDAGVAIPPPTVVPVEQPGPVNPSDMAFGAYAGLSGSVEKPALAGTLGARLRVSRRWTFGLDGEWNPWIAFNGTAVRKGAVNVYGSAMLRFPLADEKFNLRISASAGGSYLLTDLYGAPSGSVGLYLGTSPISVEWKLSRVFYLIIDPMNVAIPIPQLKGVPLVYPQYRSSIGIEIYGG